jgi:hypothetical protein
MIRHPLLLPFLALSFVCIIGLAAIAQAQNQTQATTDSDEGTAFSLPPSLPLPFLVVLGDDDVMLSIYITMISQLIIY